LSLIVSSAPAGSSSAGALLVRLLLRILLLILRRPAAGLPARDAVRHGGDGSRNDGGTRDPAK
jgi:hypothetical protein